MNYQYDECDGQENESEYQLKLCKRRIVAIELLLLENLRKRVSKIIIELMNQF